VKAALVVVAASAAVLTVLLVLRGFARRFRRLRRIEVVERRVSEAMADGRLASAPGQALLQHLEGLRRACARLRED
jgi:hypothetical protein